MTADRDRRPAPTSWSPAARGSSAPSWCARSWPAATGPGSRSSTSSPTPATAPTSRPSRRTRSRPRASPSCTATSRTRRSSAPLVAEADAVVNVAAETHVDRSILDPEAFLRTGVIGVHVLLEAVRARPNAPRRRARRRPRFLQVSTDEVYGDIPDGHCVETDRLAPRSPYAAAKAAGELLVRAYHVTYGLDVVITRGSNTYGPYQHPEKLIPLFMTNALAGEPLPMYGDGMQVRDWLHVSRPRRGHRVRAAPRRVRRGLQRGRRRPAAQPRGDRAAARGRRARLVPRAHRAGPAGPRPPLRDGRLQAGGARLGGRRSRFEEGLPATVDWYRDNPDWVAGARSGDWDATTRASTGTRLAAGRAVEPQAPRRLTDAGRGHRGRRPAGSGAGRGARGGAVHRDPRARSAGTSPRSTWTP